MHDDDDKRRRASKAAACLQVQNRVTAVGFYSSDRLLARLFAAQSGASSRLLSSESSYAAVAATVVTVAAVAALNTRAHLHPARRRERRRLEGRSRFRALTHSRAHAHACAYDRRSLPPPLSLTLSCCGVGDGKSESAPPPPPSSGCASFCGANTRIRSPCLSSLPQSSSTAAAADRRHRRRRSSPPPRSMRLAPLERRRFARQPTLVLAALGLLLTMRRANGIAHPRSLHSPLEQQPPPPPHQQPSPPHHETIGARSTRGERLSSTPVRLCGTPLMLRLNTLCTIACPSPSSGESTSSELPEYQIFGEQREREPALRIWQLKTLQFSRD